MLQICTEHLKTIVMKEIIQRNFKAESFLKINSNWYLLIGIITMGLSHLNFGIDLVAWFAMVPFLIYLTLNKGIKAWLKFSTALIIAWSVVVLKIITEPIPYFLVPMYSIPIALFHLPGYIIYSYFKKTKMALLAFPALMVIMEWIQYTFTPMASWGVAAYTQLDSPVIAQSLSLFGMSGLSFVIYFINVLITWLILGVKIPAQSLRVTLLSIVFLVIFGSIRISSYNSKGRDTIMVAAVGTDSEIGGLPLPSSESNEAVISNIFERTAKAAAKGSKLVVWTEAAFFLEPAYESEWIDSISRLADINDVSIIASYINIVSKSPLKYENKYLFVYNDGSIIHKYFKHQPVPGEPAVKGKEALETFQISSSQIGAAICYDYDFPYLASQYENAGADIVALPSSDWRGIDPLHTKMAAFRAIEQGHSIIRSTRFGLSAGINPVGQFTAKMSSFDSNDKVMITELPVKRTRTIYSYMGDLFIYLSRAFLILIIMRSFLKKGKRI